MIVDLIAENEHLLENGRKWHHLLENGLLSDDIHLRGSCPCRQVHDLESGWGPSLLSFPLQL